MAFIILPLWCLIFEREPDRNHDLGAPDAKFFQTVVMSEENKGRTQEDENSTNLRP